MHNIFLANKLKKQRLPYFKKPIIKSINKNLQFIYFIYLLRIFKSLTSDRMSGNRYFLSLSGSVQMRSFISLGKRSFNLLDHVKTACHMTSRDEEDEKDESLGWRRMKRRRTVSLTFTLFL